MIVRLLSERCTLIWWMYHDAIKWQQETIPVSMYELIIQPLQRNACSQTWRYLLRHIRIQFSRIILSALYILQDQWASDFDSQYLQWSCFFCPGSFSCIMAVFDFQRQYGYYVSQIYIPSILIVFVSWVSFWLSPECVPGRICLGVTTLLTMASQGSAVGSSLPRVRAVQIMTSRHETLSP